MTNAYSQFIVAFSNVSLGDRALGVFDFERDDMTWIDTSWLGPHVTGFDDVYRDGDHIWILPQTDSRMDSRLVDIGPSFDRRMVIDIDCGDPHALTRLDDLVLVTDTTRNRIRALRFDGAQWLQSEHARLFDAEVDVLHINSMCTLAGAVYVSHFGPKPPAGWKAARDGAIVELGSGRVVMEGLRHPHSLVAHRSAMYWTESHTGCIYRWSPGDCVQRVVDLGGYVRGLAIDDDHLYVGSSAQRGRSRSTGVRNVEASQNADDYESWLYRLGLRTGSIERRNMSRFGAEIFEIVPVGGVS